MGLKEELEAEILHRKTAGPRGGVFSVFNIGTGHTQKEPNNTIAALGHACTDDKVINDGPTGVMGNAQGWGMNDATRRTVDAIKSVRPRPAQVNMTGHSRGAILCHMIAHALYEDPATRTIKICMMVLDPVHQSKLTHKGAEALDDNPSLLSYHAIIMENEDKKIFGNVAFPFKFVKASADVQTRMHFINMPGRHGSGSQNLTSPVGKAVFHLIQNYMRARRSTFNTPVPTPLDMCELFAEIHLLNPESVDGARLVFDDTAFAKVHNVKSSSVHSAKLRSGHVARAMQLNLKTRQIRGLKVLPPRPTAQYFFNQEHAFYFKLCFPFFFKVCAAAPQTTPMDHAKFDHDFDLMGSRPALAQSFAILGVQMRNLLM